MSPFMPFAIIPVAAAVAWFGAPYVSAADPARYRVPQVVQMDPPETLVTTQDNWTSSADIRVASFLPPRKAAPPPKPKKAPRPPTLVLQSVMTGGDTALATINGQLLRVGERIAGYKVTRIAATEVVLVGRGTTRRLPMRSLHELPRPKGSTAGRKYSASR